MYSFFHRLIPPAVQCTELPCSYSGLSSEGNLSLGLLCVGWKDLHNSGKQQDMLMMKATECHPWGADTIPALWQVPFKLCYFELRVLLLFYPPWWPNGIWVPVSQKRKTILTATKIYINSTRILQRISCIVCPKKESPYHIKQGSLNKGKHFTFISLHLSSLFIKWE